MVVVPTGYGAFRASASLRTPVSETVLQLSVVTGGTIVTFAFEHASGSAVTLIVAGQTIPGGVTSATTTCCVHWAMLLEASVTFQVMVVVPTGYGAFSASASLRVPTSVDVLQLSVVTGGTIVTPVAEQPLGPAFTLIVAGHVIPGS